MSIKTNKGIEIIVDEADFDYLSKFKWHITYRGYACTTLWENGKKRNVYMHRLLMGEPKGKVVDHINRNQLDNRRENLRICTQSENARNTSKRNGSSRFKGVSFAKREQKWKTEIKIHGKTVWGGYHETEEAAALKYNELVEKHFGEFGERNVIKC